MTNLLNTGATWLGTRLQDVAGTTISYCRGDDTSDSFTATVGQTLFEQDSQFGVVTIQSRDYIFPVSELGNWGEPARGDTITEGDEVFEVLSLNGSQPFRYSDHGKTIVRVHTKRYQVTE